MTPSDDLWVSARRAQDDALRSSTAVPRVRLAMPLRASPRKRRLYPVVAAVATVLVAVIGGLGALWTSNSAPPSLAFTLGSDEAPGRAGDWLAAQSAVLPMHFSDGTVMKLDPGSRARVVELRPDGAHLVIERGGASANVVHRKNANWQLDVGPFHVTVVGTHFDLDWDPAREKLDLALHEGAVLVSGSFLEQPMRVSQGQRLTASGRDGRAELVSAKSAESKPAEPAEPAAAPASASIAPVPPPSGPPEVRWQSLAAQGKYRSALEQAIRLGFDAECRRASGDELVLLGDAARLSGDVRRARTAYLAARAKPGSTGRAAYALGLVAFDQQRSFAQAAKWFRVYLEENPPGNLRREALGRLMEALQRAGDTRGAKQAAREYLSSYPNGSYARLARELTSR